MKCFNMEALQLLHLENSPLLLTNQEGLVLSHLISFNFCLLASKILNFADSP